MGFNLLKFLSDEEKKKQKQFTSTVGNLFNAGSKAVNQVTKSSSKALNDWVGFRNKVLSPAATNITKPVLQAAPIVAKKLVDTALAPDRAVLNFATKTVPKIGSDIANSASQDLNKWVNFRNKTLAPAATDLKKGALKFAQQSVTDPSHALDFLSGTNYEKLTRSAESIDAKYASKNKDFFQNSLSTQKNTLKFATPEEKKILAETDKARSTHLADTFQMFESGPTGGLAAGTLGIFAGGLKTVAGEGIANLATKELPTVEKTVVPKLKNIVEGILREKNAANINDALVNSIYYKSLAKTFTKLPVADVKTMINNYETTGNFGKGFEDYSKFYKESMDQAHQTISTVLDKPLAYVDNYIRHAFTFGSEKDANKFVDGFSKSLKNFSTSPLKQRTFDTLASAEKFMQENGIKYKVATDNPELLRQWTVTNARKMEQFNSAFHELKDVGAITYLKSGSRIPDGYTTLNDHFAQVFFKGEQGLVKSGQYVAPKEAADVLNRFTSKSLIADKMAFKTLRGINNSLNQVQLGFSAFHAITTAVNSLAAQFGLAARGGVEGNLFGGLKSAVNAATIIGPAITDVFRGRSIANGVARGTPEAENFITKLLNPAGGRIKIENQYINNAVNNMLNGFKSKSLIGVGKALFNLPGAVTETMAKPLMEYFVPRVKLGRFQIEAETALNRATNNGEKVISDQLKRKILGGVWDSIDNFHGQMVQDNLFWNKTAKDVANSAMRAFGWSYGSLKAVNTGVADIAQTASRMKEGGPMITTATGKLLAYPAAVMYMGAIYQYLHTGKPPQELKDYFLPKNGQKDSAGNDVRVTLPGYTRDLLSYTHDPVQTVINKLAPAFNPVTELYNNQDYFKIMIRNPNDPAAQQAADVGSYLLSKLLPLSVNNFLNSMSLDKKTSTLANKVEPFLGINNAPKYLVQTKEQQTLQDLLNRQFGTKVMTKEEAALQKKKDAAKSAGRAGNFSLLDQLTAQGIYTAKGAKGLETRLKNEGQLSYEERLFSYLSKDNQQVFLNSLPADKRKQYEDLVNTPSNETPTFSGFKKLNFSGFKKFK